MKMPAFRFGAPLFWGRTSPGLLIVAVLATVALSRGRLRAAEDDLPDPETVTLETKDAALLTCQWYPSPKSEKGGKRVVPVIIVHGWGGQRTQYDGLATYLQGQGHAVIVPDLRGHGGSTTIKRPGEGTDVSLRLVDGKMELNERPVATKFVMDAMANFDMPAVKKHLMTRNNNGELNIELLTTVAFEEGSIVAVNWADYDWKLPTLPTGFKLGRDVKALALISPVQSFMGASMARALAFPPVRDDLSVMIVVGNGNPEAYGDANRINRVFKSRRPPPPDSRAERLKKLDLFFIQAQTPLQGLSLLAAGRFGIDTKITGFIKLRLVDRADLYAWTDRTLP